MWQPNYIKILGVRVDSLTWNDVDSFAKDALSGSKPNQVVTVNGEHILAAERNPKHRNVINNAELVVPDTTNVLWVSKLKGRGLAQTIPGVDLSLRLARIAAETNNSLFLLGSKIGVAEKAARKLQTMYPGLVIAGFSSADPGKNRVVEEIRNSGADIVLVAYGAPTQEYWIAEHKVATGAKILVGVGGTFDMIAGILPRAPRFVRALHLEWFWRLILQPSRIGRIWKAVVVFPLRALFH
jgi:N-acetylglucosaminyldiphosphoundecaprenol N-acetyl-beta-D-mannosaminyltransferase